MRKKGVSLMGRGKCQGRSEGMWRDRERRVGENHSE